MSDEHVDEPVLERSESSSELISSPRLGEARRGIALSVLWWMEEGEEEKEER